MSLGRNLNPLKLADAALALNNPKDIPIWLKLKAIENNLVTGPSKPFSCEPKHSVHIRNPSIIGQHLRQSP